MSDADETAHCCSVLAKASFIVVLLQILKSALFIVIIYTHNAVKADSVSALKYEYVSIAHPVTILAQFLTLLKH